MWQVNIEVKNIIQKRVYVTAIRTDTITDEVYTATYEAIVETAVQRAALLDQIKADYLAYVTRQENASDVLAGLEDTAMNALNDWEETR